MADCLDPGMIGDSPTSALWPGFAGWPPWTQGITLFLSTFVLEDVATVGAGLLLASGALAWTTAFWACFVGIWLGDVALYVLAQVAGRRWFEQSSLRRYADRVLRSERWFSRHGSVVLVLSRVMPGTRLPTYLAAGFLRLPWPRFLTITGVTSLGWTVLVLELSQPLGVQLATAFDSVKQFGWILLLGLGLSLGARRTSRPVNRVNLRAKLAALWGRWRHWEFWPPWLFYAPVAVYGVWLALKYRGWTLPTLANPGIFSGGLIGESKMVTLRELMVTSPEFTAEAELLPEGTVEERLGALRELCGRRGIRYPFVLKPEVGQRGVGVRLVQNEDQVRAYLRQTDAPLLVQRYVEGPGEAGVFYYRFPGAPHGRIFAITDKVFPVLLGDGHSTIAELVWKDPRARCLAAIYLRRFQARRDQVLNAGEPLKLVEAGNHAQGCIFRDGMHLWSPTLAARIEAISQQLTGFYIGRYDLRYRSADDLRSGVNFRIIELNGAASEATSIYDQRQSLLGAYRTLFRQWDLVFAIGAENRKRGGTATPLSVLWGHWRAYARRAATYPPAD